jgi:hypothetical protein
MYLTGNINIVSNFECPLPWQPDLDQLWAFLRVRIHEISHIEPPYIFKMEKMKWISTLYHVLNTLK